VWLKSERYRVCFLHYRKSSTYFLKINPALKGFKALTWPTANAQLHWQNNILEFHHTHSLSC